jgi:hypothetical protein
MVGPAIAGNVLPRGASERRMILNADITEDKCSLLFEPGTLFGSGPHRRVRRLLTQIGHCEPVAVSQAPSPECYVTTRNHTGTSWPADIILTSTA